MIDYSRCYHNGVRVAHLETAMQEIGEALGVTWCEPQVREQNVWLPDTGETTIPLRFTYSSQGPQHIELLEGAPGSIWDGRVTPGLHHVGVWSDDVAGDTYVQPPSGLIVELVWSAIQPMFERWFAGGPLA